MGTNFYLASYKDDMNPDTHVGKRSAAGLYCWDCRITLCKAGESGVHQAMEYHKNCPRCGKTFDGSALSEGGAAVELGFSQPYGKEDRIGVKPVSSFTWAMKPENLKRKRKIVDEYGRTYTIQEFKEKILGNCPLQFLNSIGQRFS
jgi:hypothetical protein